MEVKHETCHAAYLSEKECLREATTANQKHKIRDNRYNFQAGKKRGGHEGRGIQRGGVKSGSGKIWHNNVLIIIVRTGQW
jgi:hypothetical protein